MTKFVKIGKKHLTVPCIVSNHMEQLKGTRRKKEDGNDLWKRLDIPVYVPADHLEHLHKFCNMYYGEATIEVRKTDMTFSLEMGRNR